MSASRNDNTPIADKMRSMIRRGALLVCLCLTASAHDTSAARAGKTSTSPGPQVVAVSPGSGTGAGRACRFFYQHPDGAADIVATEAVIVSGPELTGVNACFIHASGNQFWLRDDANGAWIGPVAAGSAGRLSNTQCAVAAAGSSMSSSGDSLTVIVALTFTIPFAGPKSVYTTATDRQGLSSDWLQAGTWTVSPLNPPLDVITSSCSDPSKDNQYAVRIDSEQGGRVSKYVVMPSCFPAYSSWYPQEGLFFDDRRFVPVMGRTAGHFDVLVAFTDTDVNRRELLENHSIPAAVKTRIEGGQVREALTDLFESYTPAAVMEGIRRAAAPAVDLSFTVAVTRLPSTELESVDGGLGFAGYDAVLLLDDLKTYAGYGVRRWPVDVRSAASPPVFHGRGTGFILNVDPGWLTPGLFGNELLRRNVPTLLSEYVFGPRTLVPIDGVVYDRTAIVNPRTGENIEPLIRANEGKIAIGAYMAGYADVDADGVIDCLDPVISPTADNVDGDFIPDRFDPDLRFNHRPYSWMYAIRGG